MDWNQTFFYVCFGITLKFSHVSVVCATNHPFRFSCSLRAHPKHVSWHAPQTIHSGFLAVWEPIQNMLLGIFTFCSVSHCWLEPKVFTCCANKLILSSSLMFQWIAESKLVVKDAEQHVCASFERTKTCLLILFPRLAKQTARLRLVWLWFEICIALLWKQNQTFPFFQILVGKTKTSWIVRVCPNPGC